ncbi:hypothetical protein ACCO45_011668 [Purpureocillium lilacinum]|uniref:Uncharacterized protein n=1 Tax=Purpureocillium lilacinum TaxID=33203 RepID=A0ACC4DC33_PURLI
MSSLWNALTGGNKPAHPQQQQQQQQHYQEPQPTASSTSYATPSTFDPSQGQGVESFLQSSTFADPSQLHPLAGLNKDTLEYLTLEDSALSDLPGGQRRLGPAGGLRRSAGQPPKLRLNSVLNAVTRRGPFLGNSAGVIAIVYNCLNSLVGSLRGKHDAANSVLAGALSGMVFKSTRGLRPMMISGGVVGSVAGVWAIARRTFFPVPEPVAPIESL